MNNDYHLLLNNEGMEGECLCLLAEVPMNLIEYVILNDRTNETYSLSDLSISEGEELHLFTLKCEDEEKYNQHGNLIYVRSLNKTRAIWREGDEPWLKRI